MFFVLFIILFSIIYVKSFKSDFNEEQIQKVTPVLMVFSVFLITLAIIGSVLTR